MTIKDALALAAQINKSLGTQTIVLGADMVIPRRFTSGSLSLDVALGGGWPGNKWVEIIGKESHGKTAVALKTVAANQAADPEFTTVWVAAEHYNAEWAAALGVDNSRVIVVTTQQMEEAYQIMLQYAESRAVDCIVLDSYPALVPDEEAAKDMDELVVALGARVTSRFVRKAGKASRRSLTADADRPFLGIIINQYRDQIGGFSPRGTPQTTPGGNAKNYFYWTRVEVKRDEFIDESRPDGKGKVRVGQVIKVKTIKNKSAAPHKIATLDFYFADAPTLGFKRGDYDAAKDILLMAMLFDVIARRGSKYLFGERSWIGKEKVLLDLRAEPDLQAELAAAVHAAASSPDHDEEDVA